MMTGEAEAQQKDRKTHRFQHSYTFPASQNRLDFMGSGGAKIGFPSQIHPQHYRQHAPRMVPRIGVTRLVLTNMLMLPTLRACYGSFLVITFPGLTVKSTVPSVCIITSSYLGSTSIFPSTAITPQMPGYVSTAQ